MDLHSMAEADGDVRPPAAASAPEPYVNTRQHTSAYVSIRQHTSAYASIREASRDIRDACPVFLALARQG